MLKTSLLDLVAMLLMQGSNLVDSDPKKALKLLQKAEELFKKVDKKKQDPANYFECELGIPSNMAAAYLNLENFDEANRCFNKAAAIDNTRVPFNLNRILLWMKQKKFDSAKAKILLMLEKDSLTEEQLQKLLQCLAEILSEELYENASKEIIKQLERVSHIPQAAIQLYHIYHAKKYISKAAKVLEDILINKEHDKNYDAEIYYLLGLLKYSHSTQASDIFIAKLYFEKVINEGSGEASAVKANAMYMLGRIYDESLYGSKPDKEKAFKWYKQAAEAGNIPAMHNLAYMLGAGEGCGKNNEKSFGWYLKAAEAGHVKSIEEVMRILLSKFDFEETIHWGKKIKTKYETKSLSDINIEEAKDWFNNSDCNTENSPFYLPITGFVCLVIAEVFWLIEDKDNIDQSRMQFLIAMLKLLVEKTDMISPILVLAQIYAGGNKFPGIIPDEEYVEKLYCLALEKGKKEERPEIAGLFLQFYIEQLSRGNLQKIEIIRIIKEIKELLKQHYSLVFQKVENLDEEKFLKKLKKQSLEIHWKSSAFTSQIQMIFRNEEKSLYWRIEEISNEIKIVESINNRNLVTLVLKLAKLFDRLNDGGEFFRSCKTRIMPLFNQVQLILLSTKGTKFTANELANILTGLVVFYQHGFEPIFDKILETCYTILSQNLTSLNWEDIEKIIAAATRTNLKAGKILASLNSIIAYIDMLLHENADPHRNLETLSYHLALMLHYQSIHSEFNINVPPRLIEKLIAYCFNKLEEGKLAPIQQSQLYFALFYFFIKNQDKCPAGTEELLIKTKAIVEKDAPPPQITNFQRQCTNDIKKCFPNGVEIKVEKFVNGLPVDVWVWIKDKNEIVVIQLDGFSHLLLVANEKWEPTAKDLFHDFDISSCCKLDGEKVNKIIHIRCKDYQKAQNKVDFIHKILVENKVKCTKPTKWQIKNPANYSQAFYHKPTQQDTRLSKKGKEEEDYDNRKKHTQTGF